MFSALHHGAVLNEGKLSDNSCPKLYSNACPNEPCRELHVEPSDMSDELSLIARAHSRWNAVAVLAAVLSQKVSVLLHNVVTLMACSEKAHLNP